MSDFPAEPCSTVESRSTGGSRSTVVLRCGTLIRAALAGATLLFASQAFAGGTASLQAFIAQVHSATGEFTQRQVKAPGKAQAAAIQMGGPSSGTFSFARPGKFIWAYRTPYEQILEADGDTLFVFDKDLNQVTERKLGNALGASPAAILFGSNDLNAHFTLHDVGVKEGIDWLELIPKDRDTQFQSVGIGFQNGELNAMELHDVFGNVTLLTFSNLQKNPSLPVDAFKFVVPKGADVIKG
jgi:outer membrane lipoprotein carrier protein